MGPLTPEILARSGPRTPKENHVSTSEENYSYLANLADQALEEDLLNMACYAHRVSFALAIGGAGRCDAFLCDQRCKEKHMMKESIHSLML